MEQWEQGKGIHVFQEPGMSSEPFEAPAIPVNREQEVEQFFGIRKETSILPAPRGVRLLAALLDGFLITLLSTAAFVVLFFLFSLLLGIFSQSDAGGYFDSHMATYALSAIWLSLVLVGGWLYSALAESSESGATPGKRIMNIRVCGFRGEPLGFGTATARYFAKLLSGALCLVGYLMILFTPDRMGLHDFIASTLVVRETTQIVREVQPHNGWEYVPPAN